jgi:hypothetical protein
MGAKVHPPTAGDESFSRQYDVTVRVGNTEYVVLYVAPDVGLIDTVRYRLGEDLLVLVGPETIKYNEMTGITREVAILDRRSIPVMTTAKKPDKR